MCMYYIYILLYIYNLYNYIIYIDLDIYFSPTAQGATTSRWLNSCGTRCHRSSLIADDRWSLSWIHNNTVVAMIIVIILIMIMIITMMRMMMMIIIIIDPSLIWFRTITTITIITTSQSSGGLHLGTICVSSWRGLSEHVRWRNDNGGRRCVAAMWLVTMVVVISVHHCQSSSNYCLIWFDVVS